MEKIRLDIMGLQASQSPNGTFALVLGEANGNRRLPIIIGMPEAQAIALEMENIISNRPMTHDLFKSFAHEFKFDVEEIVISDLKDGVFFARIVCTGPDGRVEIDARPSDAIAIGLRFKAPIFAIDKIMDEAGIVLTEEESEAIEESAPKEPVRPSRPKSGKDSLEDYPLEVLKDLLEEAIEKEDYELAARIRDEIGKRN
ncbi:MAG TPA: hypothetical protein ENJ39_09005 [Flammeovirgaceae bacterium]|nr:hypothetical protein [Flammeovirgaceae bacterium]